VNVSETLSYGFRIVFPLLPRKYMCLECSQDFADCSLLSTELDSFGEDILLNIHKLIFVTYSWNSVLLDSSANGLTDRA
jgi:hypothetical protein